MVMDSSRPTPVRECDEEDPCKKTSTRRLGSGDDPPTASAEQQRNHAPPPLAALPRPAEMLVPAGKPQVLACGHRSVLIPKSRLVFPAWLVLLPDATATISTGPTTGLSARWRSKRDWTRLGRAVARYGPAVVASGHDTKCLDSSVSAGGGGGGSDSRNHIDDLLMSLPKAAMDRLVQNAPWVRPNLPMHFETYYGSESNGQHLLPKSVLRQRENHWDVRWTKSLQRMDDFLRGIHIGCIEQQQQQQQQCNRSVYSSSLTPDTGAADALVAAWQEFCRPVDADDLLPEHDEVDFEEAGCSSSKLSSLPGLPERSPEAAAARGNALGQYFCSTDSATRLVELFLTKSRCRVQRALARGPVHVTIVEPSCGDGRLLRQLVDAIEREPLLPPAADSRSTVRIVGMDIDDSVLEVGRRQHRQVDVSGRLAVEFVRGDFLASRRATVDGTTDDERKQATNKVNRLVLMIGGPPYSAGAGSVARSYTAANDTTSGRSRDSKTVESRALDSTEAMMRRNLPLQFVHHAIEEHGAEVICFLMPERCRNCSDIRELLDRHDYSCTTLESDSLFYFQGNADHRVRQPSVFQCYQRND